MHGQGASLGLLAETIRAGLEETARIEREAKRPPLPEGLTKKECRRRTLALLEALPPTKPGAMEARMQKARCFRCGRCSLAPPSI